MEPGFSPLDEELELIRGAFSPFLIQAIVRLGTIVPFEQVPELLFFFTGVRVGEETARVLTEMAGAALIEVQEAEVEWLETEMPLPPEGPAVQQVSVDGAMVPLTHGQWGEVKTLAVGEVSSNGDQVRAHDLSYFSRMTEAEVFVQAVCGEIHRRGTERAGTVCAVMDGAEWQQRVVDEYCPQAVRILDFPHAAQHLNELAQTIFGDSPTSKDWYSVQLKQLLEGDPDQVLDAIRTLPVAQASDPAPATQTRDRELAYFEKRRAQIRYAEFRQRGYPIGSGAVESANKVVVEARLKGAGMHWAPANVNPLVALRCTLCSQRWDASWPSIWRELRVRRTRVHCSPVAERQVTGPPEILQPLSTPSLIPARPWAIQLPPSPFFRDGKPAANHPWRRPLLNRSAKS